MPDYIFEFLFLFHIPIPFSPIINLTPFNKINRIILLINLILLANRAKRLPLSNFQTQLNDNPLIAMPIGGLIANSITVVFSPLSSGGMLMDISVVILGALALLQGTTLSGAFKITGVTRLNVRNASPNILLK
ncbi:hypothetical protein AAHB59_18195 [Bacillus cereus]